MFTLMFYHIKNLQSTKTRTFVFIDGVPFYHIKNLQSTKTLQFFKKRLDSFITLRIYKVLKLIAVVF